jgi:hypothetical protein
MSNARFTVILAAGFAFALATAAHAFEPTSADRAACDKDAFRLCLSAMPSKAAVMQCLRAKKADLSPRCREQFAKRGG